MGLDSAFSDNQVEGDASSGGSITFCLVNDNNVESFQSCGR